MDVNHHPPLTIKVKPRPLTRQYAMSRVEGNADFNPFIVHGSEARGCKRPSTSSADGTHASQHPPQKRNRILTPIAIMANQVFARGSPSPPPLFHPLVCPWRLRVCRVCDWHISYCFSHCRPPICRNLDVDDTDEEALGHMPSSPTKLPQLEAKSGPSALVRRSTDESLIDAIEGGQLSVTAEQPEEENDNISEQSGYSEYFTGASPIIPKCYATPEFRTPVIARGGNPSSPYQSGFTFFNGAPVGGPLTPFASSNAFIFTREGMSPYVYNRANIFKFVPQVSAQKNPFMVLLHLLGCTTGAEGISIEDFGRIFAQCSLCDRYLYIDHQEMHMCSDSRGLTNLRRFNTEGSGGNLTPEAVREWLIHHYGSLSRRDFDVLFAFCSACHRVLVGKYGADHPDQCPARRIIRRNN